MLFRRALLATSRDFLENYVKTNAPSSAALRPDPLANEVKVVNHSWVYSYGSAVADRDAVRRMD